MGKNMDLGLFGKMLGTLPRTVVDQVSPELEKARVRARTVGLERDFELAWAYEKERARVIPGIGLPPVQVLQLVTMVGSE